MKGSHGTLTALFLNKIGGKVASLLGVMAIRVREDSEGHLDR